MSLQVVCMADYDFTKLSGIVLIVTSTFGVGEPPSNGATFEKFLKEQVEFCQNFDQ